MSLLVPGAERAPVTVRRSPPACGRLLPAGPAAVETREGRRQRALPAGRLRHARPYRRVRSRPAPCATHLSRFCRWPLATRNRSPAQRGTHSWTGRSVLGRYDHSWTGRSRHRASEQHDSATISGVRRRVILDAARRASSGLAAAARASSLTILARERHPPGMPSRASCNRLRATSACHKLAREAATLQAGGSCERDSST